MLTLPFSVKIYLSSESVDMRRSIDGLMAIVRNQWQRDVYSGHLFVFYGRRRDRLKILLWDRGGFVIFYKRLERGRFPLPEITPQTEEVEIDRTQLTLLLDGIAPMRNRRPRLWQTPLS